MLIKRDVHLGISRTIMFVVFLLCLSDRFVCPVLSVDLKMERIMPTPLYVRSGGITRNAAHIRRSWIEVHRMLCIKVVICSEYHSDVVHAMMCSRSCKFIVVMVNRKIRSEVMTSRQKVGGAIR